MNKLIAIAVLCALLSRATSVVWPCGPTCHAITDDQEPRCADGCGIQSCETVFWGEDVDGYKCTLGWTSPQEQDDNCETACRAAILNDGPSTATCAHGCTPKFCEVVERTPRGTKTELGYQCVRAERAAPAEAVL